MKYIGSYEDSYMVYEWMRGRRLRFIEVYKNDVEGLDYIFNYK